MIELKVEQGSTEWFTARMGKLTGSKFTKLMPTKRQKPDAWNETQLGILRECVAELLTGEREETFTSKAMQWGNDTEPAARRALALAIDMPIRESGFWQHSDYIGSSRYPVSNSATHSRRMPSCVSFHASGFCLLVGISFVNLDPVNLPILAVNHSILPCSTFNSII